MGVKVWQISPERAVIFDRNLAKIDTLVVRVTENCHIPNHNLFLTNLYPSGVLPWV
jgi:hypothetical protein